MNRPFNIGTPLRRSSGKVASIGVVFCALLALAASISGCGGRGSGEHEEGDRPRSKVGGPGGPRGARGKPPRGERGDAGAAEAAKVPVIVEEVVRADMEAFLDGSSTLMAEEQVAVVSQATGVAVELLVEEGDRVREGQILVRLAYEELELAERAARSDLDKLRAEYDRAEALSKEELISDEEHQRLRFDFERAEIEWRQRNLDLAHTRIVAPISGVVTERMVNVGQLVQLNEEVFRLVDFDSLVAPVFIPEKYLANLRVGQRAIVRPRGLGDDVVEGGILRVSPIVDSQSGTVKVTVGLDRRAGLRPGMFANVQIVLDTHENAAVLSKKALVFEDEEPHVFVVAEGTAERRRVELGYQDAERVEITAGVEPGETIVLVGQSALKDGSAVEVQGDEPGPGDGVAPPGPGPAGGAAESTP
jgi:membrane fusion protein (multidrug efflux system)